jgi:CBS domain-containing protein
METHDVGSVVVIDRVGEVAGIVTDRDIALRGVGQGHSADIAVEDVMTRDVATVDPHADVSSAATTMVKRCIRRLPVVDEFGNVHGVVALDDLFQLASRQVDELGEVLRDQASAIHAAI